MGKATEKQKLWHAFAEWVKLRDSDENGNANCISCNKAMKYPNSDGSVHAGHLYARSTTYASLYFHPHNVNAQCDHCNTWLQGDAMRYREGLIARYGEEVLEELARISKEGLTYKWTDDDYREKAKSYRALCRAIKKDRGL